MAHKPSVYSVLLKSEWAEGCNQCCIFAQGSAIGVILAAKKGDDLLSWTDWEDSAVVYEDCDVSVSEGRMKTFTAGPSDTISSLILFF